jgi:hypothetical protein
VKTQTKQQQALASAADDAAFILEPLIVKGSKLPGNELASAVERVLRMSLTDAGLPVNQRTGVQLRGTTVEAEARKIADKLMERGNAPLLAGRMAA